MRRTKIICTLGPASDSEATIKDLITTGMDAARFNFSHGTHESHLATLQKLKRVRDGMGAAVATILDTKGPEIRVRRFEKGQAALQEGDDFTLTTEEIAGTDVRVSVSYENLHNELAPGNRILIDDGMVELVVSELCGRDIRCRVENGGVVSNNKSINIPDVDIRLPALTAQDREDLRFAVEQDFDFVAASFVRTAQDVRDIRDWLDLCGGREVQIIAKIENRQGVENLPEIIGAADGIMVARGDLGVEIPACEVPILQKRMIAETIRQGKPVITATQMLDSMIRNPRPTRAEISDVANAVFDGTSCVMLSGETANGKYPVEAVATMAETLAAAEAATDYWSEFRKIAYRGARDISEAITHACCLTAQDLSAPAIITATQSGYSARNICRFRPACPIYAMTTTERVRRRLAISWGVQPFLVGNVDSTDQLFTLCVRRAREAGVVEPGQIVVITAGIPIGIGGSTNLIRVQRVEG